MTLTTVLKLILSEPNQIPAVVLGVIKFAWQDALAELEIGWAKARIIARLYLSRWVW